MESNKKLREFTENLKQVVPVYEVDESASSSSESVRERARAKDQAMVEDDSEDSELSGISEGLGKEGGRIIVAEDQHINTEVLKQQFKIL